MSDLQPLPIDSATESWESSPAFDSYDANAKAYNQKKGSANQQMDMNQILQQAVQVAAQNPELIMAV